MFTVTDTGIQRLRIGPTATIGEKTAVSISGVNAKNARNASGAGMNGESMSTGIEDIGVIATSRQSTSRGSGGSFL